MGYEEFTTSIFFPVNKYLIDNFIAVLIFFDSHVQDNRFPKSFCLCCNQFARYFAYCTREVSPCFVQWITMTTYFLYCIRDEHLFQFIVKITVLVIRLSIRLQYGNIYESFTIISGPGFLLCRTFLQDSS